MRFRRDVDVVNGAGFLAVKMSVFVEVGAIAGGIALAVDLADEVAGDQGVEAVVNGGEGNAGRFLFAAHENLVGGRVVTFGDQHLVNHLPLGRRAHAMAGKGFGEMGF